MLNKVLVLAVGLIGTIVGFYLAAIIGHEIGVPTWIDFGEEVVISNRYYDEEKTGTLSFFGYASCVLSITLGTWLALITRRIAGGKRMQESTRLALIAWSAGSLVLCVAAAILHLAMISSKSVLAPYVEFGVMAALAYAVFKNLNKWWKSRVALLTQAINFEK